MYQKLKKLLKNSNRISSDHSYESELETLEIRIKVLVDEMTESKRTLHNIERKLKDKKAVIDVLAKEEEEAKKKFNKIQEELRLVSEHIDSQMDEVKLNIMVERKIGNREK